MNSKKWLTIVISSSFAFIIFIIFISFILDPLKIFHKPYFYKDMLHSNMRLQSKGIIKNYEFDSVILGTSMLENTSSLKASKVFNSNFFNLSLAGSSFYERSFILEYLVKNKKVKNVIYSLDYLSLIDLKMDKDNYSIKNYDYLYDNNSFNDLKVYMNFKIIKCILNWEIESCFGKRLNLDSPNEWYSDKKHLSRFGGLENWFLNSDNNQIREAFSEILFTINRKDAQLNKKDISRELKNSEEYINQYLIRFIKNNPDTNFYFFIPPYSIIKNALIKQNKDFKFNILKKNIKFILSNINTYKNVKFYAWGNKDFTSNISLYKDLHHYHPSINTKMLFWMKGNNGLLTIDNVDKFFELWEEKLLNYDLFILEKRIKDYLNESKKDKI